MGKQNNGLYLLFVFLIPVLSGCGFYLPYREVTIELPETPGRWKEICEPVEYRLLYPDYGSPGNTKTEAVEAGTGSVVIKIPKGGYVPCLLEPISNHGRLKAAGIILTETGCAGLERGEMRFRWEDGFIAGVLLRLHYRRDVFPALNIERLYREILEAAEGDVWSLDPDPIILGLSFGTFTSRSIRKLEEKELELPLPGGTWVWDNPFKEVCIVPHSGTDSGELPGLSLTPGSHHLFHAETGERVTIFVSGSEWYAVFRLSGSNISGHW